MIREEIKDFCDMKAQFEPENEDIFKAIVKTLEQEPRWIPVSERLPAFNETVIVTSGRGTYIGWINPTDKGWRVDSVLYYFMDDVLAWMPLPKPYSEVEE